jgi:hypothetical protein
MRSVGEVITREMRCVDKTLKGTSLAETASSEYAKYMDSSARIRLSACPTKHRKKTPPVDNFTLMVSRDNPPIFMNFGLLDGTTD